MSKRTYDSTVARIAGNILSGMARDFYDTSSGDEARIAKWAVAAARAIVEETQRTEPLPAVDAVREEPR